MLVPSDKYCNQNGYVSTVENMGSSKVVMDYNKLFLNDTKFPVALAQISKEFQDRGFPLQKLENVLKKLESENAETDLLVSKSGESVSISPIDRLKKVAKADIIIEIDMSISSSWDGARCDITMFAVDAYTAKSIASITGQSPLGDPNNVGLLVRGAILAKVDDFQNQLTSHFEQMLLKGREISLKVKLYDSAPFTLEDEFVYPNLGVNERDEVIAIVNAWMRKNCVGGVFNMNDASENFISFSNVRIPLYTENNNGVKVATDAYSWSKDLQKVFQGEPFNTKAKRYVRGLGEVWIIIGE